MLQLLEVEPEKKRAKFIYRQITFGFTFSCRQSFIYRRQQNQ
jgi:hypothetical protein